MDLGEDKGKKYFPMQEQYDNNDSYGCFFLSKIYILLAFLCHFAFCKRKKINSPVWRFEPPECISFRPIVQFQQEGESSFMRLSKSCVRSSDNTLWDEKVATVASFCGSTSVPRGPTCAATLYNLQRITKKLRLI